MTAMKTLVIFYSYTGHAKALAQERARKESADIAEIADAVRPGAFRAYTAGCFAALRGKAWPIKPPEADPAAYDRLILFCPVWAGSAPPAVNAFIDGLPAGKPVSAVMVSASGKSGCRDRLEAALKAKGCRLEGFEDVKARG